MAKIQGKHVPYDLKNAVINGNFDFWQRGTSFSTPASGSYTADRWRADYDGTIGAFTVSQQAFTIGQTDVPGNPVYFLRWNQTSAGSGSTIRVLQSRLEGVKNYSGKRLTVGIWAKADTTRTVTVQSNQSFGTGGSPSADVITAVGTMNLTASWQKFTFTYNVPSTSGKTLGSNNNDFLNIALFLPLNVTMTIDIAQIVINEGSVAAPFTYAGNDYAGELEACQRFYETGSSDNGGYADSTSLLVSGTTYYKVTKRAAPSITASSVSNMAWGQAGILDTPLTFNTVLRSTVNGFRIRTNNPNSRAAGSSGIMSYDWVVDAEL